MEIKQIISIAAVAICLCGFCPGNVQAKQSDQEILLEIRALNAEISNLQTQFKEKQERLQAVIKEAQIRPSIVGTGGVTKGKAKK